MFFLLFFCFFVLFLDNVIFTYNFMFYHLYFMYFDCIAYSSLNLSDKSVYKCRNKFVRCRFLTNNENGDHHGNSFIICLFVCYSACAVSQEKRGETLGLGINCTMCVCTLRTVWIFSHLREKLWHLQNGWKLKNCVLDEDVNKLCETRIGSFFFGHFWNHEFIVKY